MTKEVVEWWNGYALVYEPLLLELTHARAYTALSTNDVVLRLDGSQLTMPEFHAECPLPYNTLRLLRDEEDDGEIWPQRLEHVLKQFANESSRWLAMLIRQRRMGKNG